MPGRIGHDESVMISFRVPKWLRDRITSIATVSGVSMQEIGRCALEAEVEVREMLLADRQATLAGLAEREAALRKENGRRRRETSHSP